MLYHLLFLFPRFMLIKIIKTNTSSVLLSGHTVIHEELDSFKNYVNKALRTANDAKSIASDANSLAGVNKNNISTLKTDLSKIEDVAHTVADLAKASSTKAQTTADGLTNLNTAVTDELTALRLEMTALRTEASNTKEEMLMMKSYSRRNNLKFDGVPESPQENDQALNQCFSKMELNDRFPIQLTACHRYGPVKPGKKPRPIVARFLKYENCSAVWSMRRKLAGTSVWVKEDS